MGRKKKLVLYSITWADSLGGVNEDRVYDPDSEPKKSLLESLQCPVADEVLIALRKAFSLTFPRNPFIDGVQAAISEIRRIATDAMKPLSTVLADLNLAPLPTVINDPVLNKAQVFLFVFARTDDLDISIKVDGKRRRLLDEFQHEDATPLLTTLRAVITDTFAEAHDEDQHMEILHRIRERIQDVLPMYNSCLEAIEIEPIAERGARPDEEQDATVTDGT